jgi:hypothetical protein
MQEWLDECAMELERLKSRADQDGGETKSSIARLERVFQEREEDEDSELADLWDGATLDPDRGYLTGDAVVDAWEREFARTGKMPEF